MAKNSIDVYGVSGKTNVLNFEPENLHLVTDKTHPLYDERVHLPIEEGMVLNIAELGVLEPTMTKSTITRDQLRALAVKKVESLKFAITQSAFTNIRRGLEEELQLAEFALAAMDSESVAAVPEDVRQALSKMDDEIIAELDAEESASRAAMLHAGNSPAQSDCCPAQNVVAPAQSPIDHGYLPECECSGCKATARICTEMAVNSLVIPNEMTSEQAYEIGYYYGDPVDVFARGANWMRQHIIDSTLAAAPQLPGSDPATVPGKWIPVSERLPEDSGRYWCYVEEQNDLGKSHCQWNCSWNGDRWWVETEGGGIVTHWMPLPAAPQKVNRE